MKGHAILLVAFSAGLALGGLLWRWPSFWSWIRKGDWTSLPATVVGTAIPGAVGFWLAQKFADSSVRRLKLQELAAETEHAARARAQQFEQAKSRRDAWATLFLACDEALHPLRPKVLDLHRWNSRPGAPDVVFRAVYVPEKLRPTIQLLADLVSDLVDQHEVADLEVVAECLRQSARAVSLVELWPTTDIVAGASDLKRFDSLADLGSRIHRLLLALRSISEQQRARLKESFDPTVRFVDRRFNILDESASLKDAILRLLADNSEHGDTQLDV